MRLRGRPGGFQCCLNLLSSWGGEMKVACTLALCWCCSCAAACDLVGGAMRCAGRGRPLIWRCLRSRCRWPSAQAPGELTPV